MRLYSDTTFEEVVHVDESGWQTIGIAPQIAGGFITVFSGPFKAKGDTLILSVKKESLFEPNEFSSWYIYSWFEKVGCSPKKTFTVTLQRKFTMQCNGLREKGPNRAFDYEWQHLREFTHTLNVFSVSNSAPCYSLSISNDSIDASPVKYRADELNSLLIITAPFSGGSLATRYNRLIIRNSNGQAQERFGPEYVLDVSNRGSDPYVLEVIDPDNKLISGRKVVFVRR
jgi:hypothetical protein